MATECELSVYRIYYKLIAGWKEEYKEILAGGDADAESQIPTVIHSNYTVTRLVKVQERVIKEW